MGLIGHWRFDEGSGGSAADSSGNGRSGTLVDMDPVSAWSANVAPHGADNRFSLDFDGYGDVVDVGNLLSEGADQLAVTAWVLKRDEGDDAAVCKSIALGIPAHRFCLGVAGTTIRARVHTTDNGGTSDYDGGAISLDEWTHVAFSYDGIELSVFKDGAVTATYPVSGSIIASDQTVTIGNINLIHDRYWNGLIDDVRIYNGALEAEEVRSLAAKDFTPGHGSSAGHQY